MWTICLYCREGYRAQKITSKFCKPAHKAAYHRRKKRNKQNEARAAIGLPPIGRDKKINITARQLEETISLFLSKKQANEADAIRFFARQIGAILDEDYIRRDTARRREWNAKTKY